MKVEGLGAQDQVAGGGRYDKLIGLFGGPATPAVGFAFGFDRLIDALEAQKFKFETPNADILVAGLGDVGGAGFTTASRLRKALDAVVDYDLSGRSISKVLSHASENGVRFVVIVGEKEMVEKSVTVKDLSTQKQEKVGLENLVGWFIERI